MPSLSNQVGEHSVVLSPLQVFNGHARQFRSSQAAPEQDGYHGIAAPPSKARLIKH
jgi:hypothetical protein